MSMLTYSVVLLGVACGQCLATSRDSTYERETRRVDVAEMRELMQTLLREDGRQEKRLLVRPEEEESMDTLLNRVNELQQLVNRLEAHNTACCSHFDEGILRGSVRAVTYGCCPVFPSAVYTRWGHKSCPNDTYTELVYSGQAGGSHYTQVGGAANYVCLPPNPTQGAPMDPKYSSSMFGAEYQFPSKMDEDVPCAVCRTTLGNSVYMVPGRMTCDPGWTMAYKGVLASGFPQHHAASEFVCLDSHREMLLGGAQNEDGKLFYPVTVHCGSLKCPPYTSNRELLCAVCVK